MNGNRRIQQLQETLTPLRDSLLNHPLYGQIDHIDKLRLFMQHHIYAVWDFMSLLKALQHHVCCLDVPWLPPENRQAARFVNEIVLGEESDEDGQGGFASHFDLYYRAMQRSGANTAGIERFLEKLRRGNDIEAALAASGAAASIQQFVLTTFQIINGGQLCAITAAFTFGREDLLPGVFGQIVDQLNVETAGGLHDFKFYLSRHIELDGDHHGPMAAQLVTWFCGENEQNWQAAERAAVQSLQARLGLWDGMFQAMQPATPAKRQTQHRTHSVSSS